MSNQYLLRSLLWRVPMGYNEFYLKAQINVLKECVKTLASIIAEDADVKPESISKAYEIADYFDNLVGYEATRLRKQWYGETK